MKLNMQTFMYFGVKSKNLSDIDGVKDALVQEKTNMFPIFKNKVCTGHLQIKTHSNNMLILYSLPRNYGFAR